MRLLEEIKLKNIQIKNRTVRSATISLLGNTDGTISDREVEMYNELASNDVGLIIAGGFSVSSPGSPASIINLISDDKYTEQIKVTTDKVHQYGAKIIAQLNHLGYSQDGEHRIGPSKKEFPDGSIAKELSVVEINKIVNEFVEAAYRAKEGGMDGVQVHCAHNFLLCQFLSPEDNKREDEYGQTSMGRAKIVEDIVSGIKEKCGSKFPVFIKVNGNTLTNNDEYMKGITLLLKSLKSLGLEAVEVSGADNPSRTAVDHLYFLEYAKKYAENIEIPIILVGGIRSIDDTEKVLTSGIDMVSFSRPLIREPDLITRFKNGQEKAKCSNCNGCFSAGDKRCIFK